MLVAGGVMWDQLLTAWWVSHMVFIGGGDSGFVYIYKHTWSLLFVRIHRDLGFTWEMWKRKQQYKLLFINYSEKVRSYNWGRITDFVKSEIKIIMISSSGSKRGSTRLLLIRVPTTWIPPSVPLILQLGADHRFCQEWGSILTILEYSRNFVLKCSCRIRNRIIGHQFWKLWEYVQGRIQDFVQPWETRVKI